MTKCLVSCRRLSTTGFDLPPHRCCPPPASPGTARSCLGAGCWPQSAAFHGVGGGGGEGAARGQRHLRGSNSLRWTPTGHHPARRWPPRPSSVPLPSKGIPTSYGRSGRGDGWRHWQGGDDAGAGSVPKSPKGAGVLPLPTGRVSPSLEILKTCLDEVLYTLL